MLIGFTQPLDKLEFGGESPLTMRYELLVENPHPLGSSTGTALVDSIDPHRKNEPGVPKGWKDHYQTNLSSLPVGASPQIPIYLSVGFLQLIFPSNSARTPAFGRYC